MPFIHGIDGQLLQAGLPQRAITTTYELHPGVSAPPPFHALILPYPAEEALRLTDNALGQARWVHGPYFASASLKARLDLLHPTARLSTTSPYIDNRGERVVLCETRPGMPDRVVPRLERRRVRREQPTVSMKDLVVPHSPSRKRIDPARKVSHDAAAGVPSTGSHEANDRPAIMVPKRQHADILRKDSIHGKDEGGEKATDDMDIDLATDPAPTSSHSGTLQGPSKRLKTTTSPKHPQAKKPPPSEQSTIETE